MFIRSPTSIMALLPMLPLVYPASFIIMEPMTTFHFLHERQNGSGGDYASSRSTLLALSICLAALLLLNSPTAAEAGKIQSQDVPIKCDIDTANKMNDKPLSSSPSKIILQYKVNRHWTKHAGMRRAASEPVIQNKELVWTKKKASRKLRDLSWYAKREKAHIENFFEEMNFNMAPSSPDHQQRAMPSDPIPLPDAHLFRAAPHGWTSIMGATNFYYFPESNVKALSLQETGDLFAFAQNRRCSSSTAITSCKAFKAMDKAAASVVAGSPSLLAGNTDRRRGSMDALLFCGAMRLFADWRVLRQVPPSGYSSYAAGINLGHKDIVLNVKKIENAARAWMERRKAAHGTIHKRPTLRDLLTEEIEANIHTKGLPQLEDDSAATGLLWARRQLEYQHKLYRNANDAKYKGNIREAVRAAYDEVYGKYHGWAVRKVFGYSAAAAPPLELLIEHMTGKAIEDGRKEMIHFSNVVEPILDDLLGLLHEMNMHDEGKA